MHQEPTWFCRAAVVATVFLSAAGEARAAEIGVVGATVGTGGTRNLSLIVEAAAFDWPITIRRNDSSDSTAKVRIDVTPLIGPSAQTADQQHLLVGGQPVDSAVIELSSLDQATVRITGTLPVEGDFKGQLGIILGEQRLPYDVTVTRRKPTNPPKVAFVGVGSDGRLAMTSDHGEFKWPITIRRDDTLTSDVDVRLRVSHFAGPSGTLIEPRLVRDGIPVTDALKLPALGQESLQLVGKAGLDGTYTGEITYELAGARAPVTLVLTRSRPDFDLKVESIAKIRGTTWGDEASLQVRLQNQTDIDREIYLPIIASFNRIDASGSTPVEIGTAGYRLTVALQDGRPAPEPLRVPGSKGLDLHATIHGLTDPGSYKGVMRFAAADRKPMDTPFELSIRILWFWAALAIALGVVAAAVLRYVQQTARPRLIVQRNAVALRSKLATFAQAEGNDLAPRERQAIGMLIQQLDDATDEPAAPDVTVANVAAAINTTARKIPLLPLWITARRRHDALQPPQVAAAIEPALDEVFATLTNPDVTDTQMTEARNLLNGIEAKIAQALQAYIVSAVAAVRTAIGEFDAAERPAFAQAAADLDRAMAESNANPPRLKEAAQALAMAQSGFAETAARLLRAKLDPDRPAIGFSRNNGKTSWSRWGACSMQLLSRQIPSGASSAGATSTVGISVR
jgi:hypothetical protein